MPTHCSTIDLPKYGYRERFVCFFNCQDPSGCQHTLHRVIAQCLSGLALGC